MMRVLYEIGINALRALSKDPKSQLIIVLLVAFGILVWSRWTTDTQSSNDFVMNQLKNCEKALIESEKGRREDYTKYMHTERKLDSVSYKLELFSQQFEIFKKNKK